MTSFIALYLVSRADYIHKQTATQPRGNLCTKLMLIELSMENIQLGSISSYYYFHHISPASPILMLITIWTQKPAMSEISLIPSEQQQPAFVGLYLAPNSSLQTPLHETLPLILTFVGCVEGHYCVWLDLICKLGCKSSLYIRTVVAF